MEVQILWGPLIFFMLIGICGKMGSGKDTIAEHLAREFQGQRMSFARKLKSVVANLFNVDKNDKRGREILQKVGAFMRSINEFVWIDAINYDMSILKLGGCENFIISDVRYVNEAESIIKDSGIVIVLNISSNIRRERIEKRDGKKISDSDWIDMNSHESESDIAMIRLIDGVENVFITPNDDEDIVNMKVKGCLPKVIL